MTIDPFHGRATSEGAPYDNALIVTPADGDSLPVIPSALTLPHIIPDAGGNGSQSAIGMGRFITVEMQNGTELQIYLTGYDSAYRPSFYPIRPTRILWDKSEADAVTLLW